MNNHPLDPNFVMLSLSLSDLLAIGSEEKPKDRIKSSPLPIQKKDESLKKVNFGNEEENPRNSDNKEITNIANPNDNPLQEMKEMTINSELSKVNEQIENKLEENENEQNSAFTTEKNNDEASAISEEQNFEQLKEVKTKVCRKSTEIIKVYIKENKRPFPGMNYCLLEDIVILSSLFDGDNKDVWKNLGNHLLLSKRTLNSIRDRYRRYLKSLNLKNYQEILVFLEKHLTYDLRKFCLLFVASCFKRIEELSVKSKGEKSIKSYPISSNFTEKSLYSHDDQFDFEEEKTDITNSNNNDITKDCFLSPTFKSCEKKQHERKTLENFSNHVNNKIVPKIEIGDKIVESRKNYVYMKKNDDNQEKAQKSISFESNASWHQNFHKHNEKAEVNNKTSVDLSSVYDQKKLIFSEKKESIEKKLEPNIKIENTRLKRKESPVSIQIHQSEKKLMHCPHNSEIYFDSLLGNISDKFRPFFVNTVVEEIPFFNFVIIQSENPQTHGKTIIKTPNNFDGNVLGKIIDMGQYYTKSVKELFGLLDSLNGNLEDLEFFLAGNGKNQFMLWLEEEDKLLQGLISKDSLDFRILKRYKDSEKIKVRAKYKNILLPFDL